MVRRAVWFGALALCVSTALGIAGGCGGGRDDSVDCGAPKACLLEGGLVGVWHCENADEEEIEIEDNGLCTQRSQFGSFIGCIGCDGSFLTKSTEGSQ